MLGNLRAILGRAKTSLVEIKLVYLRSVNKRSNYDLKEPNLILNNGISWIKAHCRINYNLPLISSFVLPFVFSEQLSNSIMAELSRTRRRSEDDGLISTRQLQQTCSRLLLEFESQIRSEYDRILSEKLSGTRQSCFFRDFLFDLKPPTNTSHPHIACFQHDHTHSCENVNWEHHLLTTTAEQAGTHAD